MLHTVLVPKQDTPYAKTHPHGTAFVGLRASEWSADMGRELTAGRLVIDYEEPGRAANIVTFADRVFHAADRQLAHYPTHKRMWPPAGEWVEAGIFYPSHERIEVRNVEQMNALRRWLFPDLKLEEGFQRLDTELRCDHGRVAR